ncbi:MAG: glycosyltransferase family 2 protein, partial [Alphaproteobacteria bacterium]|nr:glycosyltransferase family 2 protein [Alphaproteobacteria bacterium]
MTGLFTAVIPTKGRPAILREAIASVAANGRLVTEIIVVDGTREAVDEAELHAVMPAGSAPRLVFLHAPEDSGLPAARNRAIRIAQGDYVQMMDDDTTVTPGYFESIQEAFAAPDVGGVAPTIVDEYASSRTLRALLLRLFYIGPFRLRKDELFLDPPSTLTPSNSLPGASAWRRAVFVDMLYDEALTGPAIGEDLEFSTRAGKKWRLLIQPAARMIHHRSPDERPPSRRLFADKVVFFHYHFRKNMVGTPLQWLAF